MVRPYWSPLVSGIALGLALLITFFLTSQGLGASGFFTRMTAWLGGEFARPATVANWYLGPYLKTATHPLADWISWETVGVLIGGFVAAVTSGRFRLRLNGAPKAAAPSRVAFGIAGGVLTASARGCTSGIGLSGGAPLAVAAFVFLIGFFIVGISASYLVRRGLGMSLPLYDSGVASGLLKGVLFGYVLESAGFASPRKLTAQFRFTDWSVFKVMFTAIIVAGISLYAATAGGLMPANGIYIPTNYFWAMLAGGALVGAGMAHPVSDVLEDRALQITSEMPVDLLAQIRRIETILTARGAAW